jgi:hypothetical protein
MGRETRRQWSACTSNLMPRPAGLRTGRQAGVSGSLREFNLPQPEPQFLTAFHLETGFIEGHICANAFNALGPHPHKRK